jgi:site-specific DNA-methyltransferase (adenine-specific)
MNQLPRNTILGGDATEWLRQLPMASVDCVITSPPYYQLRDYGMSGQIGLEPTVSQWVTNVRMVLAQVARVLKPTGALWLNVGDSFSRHPRSGGLPKGLFLAPERLALALTRDGWLIRNKVVWAKTNPMPSSITDRLTLTYEIVYFLVRSPQYFFDLDSIREPHRSKPKPRRAITGPPSRTDGAGPRAVTRQGRHQAVGPAGHHPAGKNPGDVWALATAGYRGHSSPFPEQLVRRPLLATCPQVVCRACGRPWQPQASHRRHINAHQRPGPLAICGCDAPTMPGVVLDPFFGTGTVGVVAQRHGRDWVGIELNPTCIQVARDRLGLAPRERLRGVKGG